VAGFSSGGRGRGKGEASVKICMSLDEVVKAIVEDESYMYREDLLDRLAEAEIPEEKEEAVVSALVKSFWKLPKVQNQEKWTERVVVLFGEKSRGREVLWRLVKEVERVWGSIGIRRIEKFCYFLEKVARSLAGDEIEKFFYKGPSAEFDLSLVRGFLQGRDLSEADSSFLLEYAIRMEKTYFRSFFGEQILPRMRLTEEMRSRALEHGKRPGTEDAVRALLYSMVERE
jgi:hypothetical protein